jgi:16S rRNA (adenine1518-N6/adenine1519-N6)-dimethyltransferase
MSHFAHKKSLGQHFLNNTRIPKHMVKAGEVGEGDCILEIGPGTGILTRALLDTGAHVVAIEADKRAVEVLNSTFVHEITQKRLEIVHSDIRTLDITQISPSLLPHTYTVVANIPYYLSGMLFRTFLETEYQPKNIVFLVQKEVAERIARDKRGSLLSLGGKVYGTPHYICTVKRGNFTPPPAVDSAIIAIDAISRNSFTHIDESFFFTILHAGFKSKRKQLLGNLSSLVSRDTLVSLFNNLSIPLDVRGEDLPLSTWLNLTEALLPHTK